MRVSVIRDAKEIENERGVDSPPPFCTFGAAAATWTKSSQRQDYLQPADCVHGTPVLRVVS